MSRPKLNPEDLRSVNFTIRLTAAEQRQLERSAEVCGVTPAVMVRSKLFKGRFPEPRIARIELDTYPELKKIGTNLNQLTRLANAGKFSRDLVKTLMELSRGIRAINTQIISHDSDPENR